MYKSKFIYLLPLLMLLMLVGCKSTKESVSSVPQTNCLSARVLLTVPTKENTLQVNGTMKLVSGERLQLSFLMPILRTEVARVEVTPDELLLVDRMGRRYTRATIQELKSVLPRKATFANLEKLLYKAAEPGGKRVLAANQLGLPNLEKGQIELTDFSTDPFTLHPTELSSRYTEVEPIVLLEMLLNL